MLHSFYQLLLASQAYAFVALSQTHEFSPCLCIYSGSPMLPSCYPCCYPCSWRYQVVCKLFWTLHLRYRCPQNAHQPLSFHLSFLNVHLIWGSCLPVCAYTLAHPCSQALTHAVTHAPKVECKPWTRASASLLSPQSSHCASHVRLISSCLCIYFGSPMLPSWYPCCYPCSSGRAQAVLNATSAVQAPATRTSPSLLNLRLLSSFCVVFSSCFSPCCRSIASLIGALAPASCITS